MGLWDINNTNFAYTINNGGKIYTVTNIENYKHKGFAVYYTGKPLLSENDAKRATHNTFSKNHSSHNCSASYRNFGYSAQLSYLFGK